MKIFIKIILLIIITIAIYFIIPRGGDRLIYIPPKIYNSAEAMELQNTPLSNVDISILKYLEAKDGWVRLSKDDNNLIDIYNRVLEGKREKTRKMVLYGGESIEDFLKKIAKQANLNLDKLKRYYHKFVVYPEGELIAKKYSIPFNTSEDNTIAYMLIDSHNIYRELLKNRDIYFTSKEFEKYLIIASIIEKETQNYKEMPLISAVIHNRLKKDMRLQLDATLNYGKNRHTAITPKIIKEDNSAFNTYKHKGLPPQPLCSVSIEALKAAINPAKVNYLYFVKSGKGHTFSNEYKKHLTKVKKYKHNLAIYKKEEAKIVKLIKRPIKVKFPKVKPTLNINAFKPKFRYNI